MEWAATNPGLSPDESVSAWLAASMSDRSPATVRRRKASASRFLKWAGVGADVDFKLPSAPPPDPHPLPTGQSGVDAMMTAAPSLHQELLIGFGGKMGLRVSESITLRATDIDPLKRAARVLGKGAKFRVLPVPASLEQLIAASVAKSGDMDAPLVPIANSTARSHVKQVALRAGFGSGVSSHDLRATFATEMYHRTKDIAVVQKWLGHSSPETTRRYVQVELDLMRAALGGM